MKKNVILFTKNKIFIYSILGIQKDGSLDFTKLGESEWNSKNIEQRIGEMKEAYKLKDVVVLLSDELSYIASLEIKASEITKDERSSIESKVADVFPDDVSELVWDYKLIKRHADLNIYQLIAIDKKFFLSLETAFKNNEINVEFVEPITYALARTTKDLEYIHLLVYSGEFGVILSVVYKSAVIFSATYDVGSDMSELFKRFKEYVVKKFEVSETIEVVSNVDIEGLKATIRKLNPLEGILVKKKHRGKDSDFLFIEFQGNEDNGSNIDDIEKIELYTEEGSRGDDIWSDSDDEYYDSDDDSDDSEKKKLYVMVGFLVFLILLAGVLIYVKKKDKGVVSNNNDKSEIQGDVPKESSPEPVLPDELSAPDEPTPEAEQNVDLSEYKILVQNGAGIAGAAGNAKKLLEDVGFKDIDIGNADAFTYEKTQIVYKASVPQKVFDAVKDVIKKEYNVEFPIDVLEPDNEYDVVITVGSLKADEVSGEEL